MSSTKTVWVLDITAYLEYLEQCLDQLIPQFPWLGSLARLDLNTHWRDIHPVGEPVSYTPRDDLVTWILKKELFEVFCLPTDYPEWNPLFDKVHNVLVGHFDLNWITSQHLFIPNYRYEIYSQQIHRHGNWLYLENEIDLHENKHNALSPVGTVTSKKQFLY